MKYSEKKKVIPSKEDYKILLTSNTKKKTLAEERNTKLVSEKSEDNRATNSECIKNEEKKENRMA